MASDKNNSYQSNKGKTNNKNRSSASAGRTSRNSGSQVGTAVSHAKKGSKGAKAASEQPAFMIDIYLIVTIAITILLFIGNLGFGGMFGKAVCGFLFGFFGILNYLFPAALILGVFYYFSNRTSSYALRKLIYAGLFSLFLMMFTELLTHEGDSPGAVEAFYYSRRHHTGGGFLGGFLSGFFTTIFGTIGAYVIDILAMILFIVLMSERSGVRKLQEEKKKHDAMVRERKEAGPDIRIERPRRRPERENSNRRAESEKVPARPRRKIRESRITTMDDADTRRSRRVSGVTENTEIQPDVVTPEQPNAEAPENEKEVRVEKDREAVEVQSVDRYDLRSDHSEKLEKAVMPRIHSEAEPEDASSRRTSTQSSEVVQPQSSIHPASTSDLQESGVRSDRRASNATSQMSEQPAAVEAAEKPYIFPSVELLNKVPKKGRDSDATLQETAQKLQDTLKNFGINVQITDISCGPAVTRYELQPEMGVKVSRIVNLQDDIKMNLAATDIRIEAPIPGKAAIGIEVPNKEPSMVPFRDVVESPEFQHAKSKIAFGVGRDIAGKVVISDIGKMPHLLIAGATGSGKSVCINTIIMSILYRAKPDEVKFIMIDPKVVELSVYNGIPHLLIPVVTDPKKASAALQWAVNEMTMRYKKFADTHVRDMKGYNSKIKNGKMKVFNENGEEEEIEAEKMPQIVVIVDELADLMMVASKEVEESICRLAQLARAAGIHLVIATQRPSVNVITGLIKANMPSRIAFSVTSGVDSRTILDMTGAEKLLGKGDMLYYPQGLTKPVRVQGCFVSDEEVGRVVKFLKDENPHKGYDDSIREEMEKVETEGYQSIDGNGGGFSDERDEYFADAARLVIEKEKGSIGMLQRNFKIGFNRAARIMDQLEDFGVVGPEEGTKPRKILINIEEFEDLLNKGA